MTKQLKFWRSLLSLAALLCAPLALFGGVVLGQAPNNWKVEQVGGAAGGALTSHLKISFTTPVAALDGSEIIVVGAGELDAKVDLLTGKLSDKPEGAFIQKQGNDFLVRINAKCTGNATVTIRKAGVSAEPQKVKIFGKVTLPEKTKPLNYKGVPAGYTGTTFVDDNYPKTSDLRPYVLDDAGGKKYTKESTAKFGNDYMPLPAPNNPKGQTIPGLVLPAFYDNGGVNVGFWDKDRNHGSGGLNGGPAYKNSFRMGNPVPSTSYVKGFYVENKTTGEYEMARSDGGIVDFHKYSMIWVPEEWINMMYIGWTDNGPWLRMTVNVEETGIYEVQLFYSMQREETLKFSLDFDPEKTEAADVAADTKVDCEVPTTYNANDPTGWRKGPHCWNKCTVAYVYLQKGQSVMTVRIPGGPNLCHFDFTLVD
jgi:hypothetical protein